MRAVGGAALSDQTIRAKYKECSYLHRAKRLLRVRKILCGYRPGMGPAGQREAIPPWRRVADALRQRIESGEFPPGAALPSLSQLQDEYGVSTSTARKAVASLRDEGLVESVRGWGSFVKR